jgi:hypothetical protein
MHRALRERPRKIGASALALIAVLAVGWLAGAGTAGSAPAPIRQVLTVHSTTTATVTRTVTVPQRHQKQRHTHRR